MARKTAARHVEILLADDHSVSRRGLRALLETNREFDIVGEARDGRETLLLVKELEPDIVILDISMPDVNGLDVLRILRRAAPTVKVLILTMHLSFEVARESLRAGALGYVVKSDAESELVEAVNSVSNDQPFFTPQITKMFDAYTGPQVSNPVARREMSGEPPIERLTQREQEILALVCQGMSNKEAASQIGVATRTVEAHRQNIMHKLQTSSFSDLVRYAVRRGIVPA